VGEQHAAAMLMVIRDYLQPLPPEGPQDTATVTGDLETKVVELREGAQHFDVHG